MEVESYSCPSCGSVLTFDSEKQLMICSHCGKEMFVSEVNQAKEELEKFDNDYEDVNDRSADCEEFVCGEFDNEHQTGDFKRYRCSGCGAEIITEDNTAATFCSFCGRPSLMEDRLTGELLPAYVIPFQISKDEAVNMYKDWLKHGALTPTKLRKETTIEKITGIYVPFWLYDYKARMKMEATATKVRSEVRGNYRYTHTDYFDVVRDVETEYVKIPADASENMPDVVMDKLEPFMYAEMKEFSMPYLSGYYAEKYDYTSEEMAPRVENRVGEYIYKLTKSTISGYSSVHVTSQKKNLNRLKAKYAMLPVWMLNYTYNGKQRMFAINGQTGKIVADRPISIFKTIGWFVGITGISFLLLFFSGKFV